MLHQTYTLLKQLQVRTCVRPEAGAEVPMLYCPLIAPRCLVVAFNHRHVWVLCMLTVRLAEYPALPLLKGTVSSHAGRA